MIIKTTVQAIDLFKIAFHPEFSTLTPVSHDMAGDPLRETQRFQFRSCDRIRIECKRPGSLRSLHLSTLNCPQGIVCTFPHGDQTIKIILSWIKFHTPPALPPVIDRL